jgi:hypothetical protein
MADLVVDGFAYGEALEGLPLRSLGFRLLVPMAPKPWSQEIEALARQLQATTYPESWPATDLFASILLEHGGRMVAVARYGVTDHTPSRRRGGLEMIGVVAPACLGCSSALAIDQSLRIRRHRLTGLRDMESVIDLAELLESNTPLVERSMPADFVYQKDSKTSVFAATTAWSPDLGLGILQEFGVDNWQWLPLIGADFPLETYAARGHVFAWIPATPSL